MITAFDLDMQQKLISWHANLYLTAEFAETSRRVLVSEPEDSTTTSISLTVERTGGDTGVVEVSWTLTSDSGELKHNIQSYCGRIVCMIVSVFLNV